MSDMRYSEFCRMAKEKDVYLELLYRFGDDVEKNPASQPARLLGQRKIVAVRSYGFDVEDATDKEKTSQLRIERVAQYDYTDGILSVFGIGERPATKEEQEVFDSWQEKQQANPDLSYWSMVGHFMNSKSKDYRYLLNQRRRRTDEATGREILWDKNVRGDLILKYRVTAKEKEETEK